MSLVPRGSGLTRDVYSFIVGFQIAFLAKLQPRQIHSLCPLHSSNASLGVGWASTCVCEGLVSIPAGTMCVHLPVCQSICLCHDLG